MPTLINELTPVQQHAQQEIARINSKPRCFTQQQTAQLSTLNQEIKALKNHLQELEENPNLNPELDLSPEDEQEINNNEYLNPSQKQQLKRTWPINKRINWT